MGEKPEEQEPPASGYHMLPEEQAVAKLRAAPYAIVEEKIAALEEFFRQLRRIDERVMAASPTVLYESQWALLGIVSRSYQLMLCCIEQIAGGNPNGFTWQHEGWPKRWLR